MDVVILGAVLNTFVPKLYEMINEKNELRSAIRADVEDIGAELLLMAAAIEDHQVPGKITSSFGREWIEQARRLARDIEDCIDRFLHPAVHMCPMKFARKIRDLKKRAEKTFGALDRLSTSARQDASSDRHNLPPSQTLVGMEPPIEELRELVLEPHGETERKVISIVGFGGLGKTLLADEFYNDSNMRSKFPVHAWVRATDRDAKEVLMEILNQVVLQNGASTSTGGQQVELGIHAATTSDIKQLTDRLKSKIRYLIVIDDVGTKGQWDTIEYAFPENGVGSRIIVTTTIQSVADHCSSGNGHVYRMKTLGDDLSRDLFFNVFSKGKYSDTEKTELDSSALLKKCDGLPLALVSTARLLKSEDKDLTSSKCEEACRKLCAQDQGDTLERMQWVLMNKYAGLSGALKACLLYFYMFPCDNPTRRNSLMRQWVAEGFVKEEAPRSALGVAFVGMETLIDHSIIQSKEASNNGNVKRCLQPPGMMREFISHKSMSESFITLSCGHASRPAKPEYVRRLSLRGNTATDKRCISDVPLSLVRTLAVSGKACDAVLDFDSYELLRVLDLKECDDTTESHLKYICKLFLLKYLSLGNTIGQVPRIIGDLTQLETLDMRRTEIVTVPAEVIKLPNLKHLLGKFQLYKADRRQNTVKDSKLETLSGFVAHKSKVFAELILQNKDQMRKVKIWFGSKHKANQTDSAHLSEAIMGFAHQGNFRDTQARSLSIDFEECSEEPLNHLQLQGPGRLTSLKLRGKLAQFPQLAIQLTGIKELRLSSTTLSGKLIIDGLSNLRWLLYLKLHEYDLGDLDPQDKQFPSLRRICFSSNRRLPRPEIIGHFGNLKELYLYAELDNDTRCSWEKAATNHPKRPMVFLPSSR